VNICFGAWNEPDLGSFGTSLLEAPAGVDKGRWIGSLVAEYWRQAQAVVGRDSQVITPEFSEYRDLAQSVIEGFISDLQEHGGGQLGRMPKFWGFHNYGDLFPLIRPKGFNPKLATGDAGMPTTVLQSFGRAVGASKATDSNYELWDTETGAQLAHPGVPIGESGGPVRSLLEGSTVPPLTPLAASSTAAFEASRKFASMGQWSGRLKRAVYYQLRGVGETKNNVVPFESSLLTPTGQGRPAFCGLLFGTLAKAQASPSACLWNKDDQGFGAERPTWAMQYQPTPAPPPPPPVPTTPAGP
jgi:hypothetical protein